MMATATALARQYTVADLDDLAEAFQWFHDLLPETAKDELAAEQAEGNLLPPVVTFVDGRKSDDLNSVKIFGQIRYVNETGPIDKAMAALAALAEQNAPHRTGWYASHFEWVLNGRKVSGPPTAEQVGPNGNVMLMNMTPYASWLEVKFPTGVLFAAYTSLKRAFGRSVNIAYLYVNPDHFGGMAWPPTQKKGAGHYMVPAVLLGNPGSSVVSGTSVRGKKGARKRADKRAGRGHRMRRGIGRGSKPQ